MVKRSLIMLSITAFCVCFMQGCSSAQPEMKSDGYSFGIGSGNYADTFCCYRTKDRQTAVLDYDSMNTSLLCTKPNCNHTGDDCIVKRLNGNIPVFGDHCAYYFVDDESKMVQNDEGKRDLLLGSNLYRYDFGTNQEEQLLHVDGACVAENCKGMMLDHGVLYFVENKLGRSYDEEGILSSYGSHGGELSLHAVDLSDLKVQDLCALYDPEDLGKTYPKAPFSGSVTMQGKYDNKIYFSVGFLMDEMTQEFGFYTTYYDLADGSYHGTPEDYTKIDFGRVMFLSENDLVICRKKGEIAVYKKGSVEPIILEDEYYFGYSSEIFADDNVLFCADKLFDLNTKESRVLKVLEDEKHVIAKYGDDFIAAKRGDLGNYEKISANKLLK